jgi:hypothetical protein
MLVISKEWEAFTSRLGSYQLLLHLNDIDHSKTKARHPQTNEAAEKLNQTVLEEFMSTRNQWRKA